MVLCICRHPEQWKPWLDPKLIGCQMLPSSIRPLSEPRGLQPDVTVGPAAKFAISRLLLGITTVIWFCIGLS